MPAPDVRRESERPWPREGQPPWTEGGEPAPPEARLTRAEARAYLRAFHRMRRRILWSGRHGWGHLLTTAYLFATRPFQLLWRLAWMTRRRAPWVRERRGVPVRRQVADMLRLVVRHGLGPADYYDQRLYEPGRMALAEFVVRPMHNVEIFAGFHGWNERPFDKLESDARCREAGLPTIPILATCPPGGPPEVRLPDSPLWEDDLFSKAAGGGQGRGARRWRRADDGSLSDGTERVADVEALLTRLSEPRGDRRDTELVQPCARNHDVIHRLTVGGLSTVRVATVQRSRGRAPEVVYAMMKLVVGDRPVDNMSAGGNLVAAVDVATGRLEAAFHVAEDQVLRPVERHPDSGHPIRGTTIPFWRRTIELCREGQAAFPEIPSLGWDVAATPDGPVLVEPNINWVATDLGGWPIGLTPYPRWTTEWIERTLRARRRTGTP